jgi:hypothetical protein
MLRLVHAGVAASCKKVVLHTLLGWLARTPQAASKRPARWLAGERPFKSRAIQRAPLQPAGPAAQGSFGSQPACPPAQVLTNQKSGTLHSRPCPSQAAAQLWSRSAATERMPGVGSSFWLSGSSGQKRWSAISKRAPLQATIVLQLSNWGPYSLLTSPCCLLCLSMSWPAGPLAAAGPARKMSAAVALRWPGLPPSA